jgi:gamma-glutamyl-gamma-aminobutyrate hydrolase PuuD
MKRKIYVVGGALGYANWMQGKIVKTIQEADLVVFTGGEDVSPHIYGEEKNPKTGNNERRDDEEAEIFRLALYLNKHIIGICRGSQFTCAMSGGRLVQHQQNPHYIHDITTSTGEVIPITSTHHQAMYPYDMYEGNYKLLAWTEGISKMHENGLEKEISDKPFKEAEICYFPKTKVLGIQGHPESMAAHKYPTTFEYLSQLLDNHLEDKL